MKVLVLNSAKVNAQDYEDNTPLHIASERGYGEIVEFLLKNQADPKKKNTYKNTPIDLSLNEETRRIYDKFLKEGEQYEVNDFIDGKPISGRTNHISRFLYFASKTAEIENKKKNQDSEIDDEENKIDQRTQSAATQGSKIMKIPMQKEEKAEKESKVVFFQ